MNYKTAQYRDREMDSRFCGNDSGQKIDSCPYFRRGNLIENDNRLNTLFLRKGNLSILIIFLLLMFSFVTNTYSSEINITNIWYEKVPNFTHLTIKASGAISEFNTSYLEDPERIVIEINNATFNINMIYNIEKLNRDIALLNRCSVKKVECVQIEDKASDIVKIIISLSKKVNYEIYSSDDKTLLYIDINDYSESEELEKQTMVSLLDETIVENNQKINTYSTDTETVELIETSSDRDITNIWYEKVPNYIHLTIKSSGAISDYNVFYLENPERIVIDIHNTIYSIKELIRNILLLNMGSVKQVRCGQFESEPIPITRFVIDLFQKANYEVKLSNDKRLLYVNVYDYFEFRAPEKQVLTVTPVKGEVEKIEKEEAPEISLVDKVTEQITLNLKEAEVLDALRALSEISGINIIADDSVTGNITLNLKDVSFKDALDLILKIKGLDYTEISNTLVIAAKDVIQGYKKPVTRIFELKNASAGEAKSILDSYIKEGTIVNIVADKRLNTLIITGTKEEIGKLEEIISTIDEELLTKTFKIDNAIDEEDIKAIQNMLSIIIPDAENRIKIDNRQNEIIVKGTREELNKVEELIPKLDKRATQMRIEVKFIEVSLNKEKDLGIKWTSGGEEGQISIGEITLGGSLERFDLIEAQIRALQKQNKLNILSNPTIHAFNGKKAFILSGSRVPYEEETPEGGTKITWENVGVNMTLTPWISSDGLITMLLRAEKSYLGAVEVRDLRTIETQQIGYKEGAGPALLIRTYPDKIAVVGGLIKTTDKEDIVKIPLLGDIPILGELFKRTTKIHDKTEIIILITAHLLDY